MRLRYGPYRKPEEPTSPGGASPAAATAAAPAAAPAAPAAPATPAPAAAPASAAPAAAPATPAAPAAAAPVEGAWAPPDWRERLSKGSEANRKILERYATLDDYVNSGLVLRQKISAGELRAALPKDATPEQMAEWRRDSGIPDSPDGYDLKLKDGLVVGDKDKPIIGDFLKTLHVANANNQLASAAVDWYYDFIERQTAARQEKDMQFANSAAEALRAELGAEYQMSMNMVHGLIDTMPEEVREIFKGARLANQDPLMAHPAVLRGLINWARQINPVTTVVPNAGANVGSAIDDEIGKIENTMRTDRTAYNKDEKMQARYRDLLDARERAAGQRAAGLIA